ncbi:MAG: YdbH domain-containing protein, partial [Proteobacteria bacterium]|nr:YdbH domain-containing protein [Pseudomonadota bacterium]
IEAIGGGVIRYRGDAAVASLTAAGGSGELLAKALANFQYSQLKLTFGGPLGGQMTAKAEIKGANPELYGGKKIELNVDLQGDLRDLLQSASVLRDLPAPIRERIERRAGRP